MIRPRLLVRLIAIQRVLVRYGLDELIVATHLLRPMRFVFRLLPGRAVVDEPLGVRIRLALQELGPIFVKFGQAISTRRDLLPVEVADELAKLQDQVPPFASELALEIIEKAYGKPAGEVFGSFEEQALAAASIAQVHAATLPDGTEVVVKMLRPGMRQVIERDLEVMYFMAGLAHRYWREARRLRPVEVVREYEKTIIDELDLMREAANAAQLKRNFAGSDLLHVPEMYFDYCHVNVIVMERIHGIPISNMRALREAGADIKRLAEKGVEIFFTQVFRHNFFHADMHPGNIFIQVHNPNDPKYAAVDFGIVGTLNPVDQRYLAENFLAFFEQDYHRVAKLHIDSGWVPPDTRVDELESAVRTVCEPIASKPLDEISFAQVLMRLFETARRFDMQVQPQLILLQKTLLNIEGLGRELYPQLDLWETAYPIMRQWMTDRLGGKAMIDDIRDNLPELRETLRELPHWLKAIAEQSATGDLRVRFESRELKELQASMARQQRQRFVLAVAAAAFVGGIVLLTTGQPAWLGWSALGASALIGLAGRPGAG
jgi:ubiquinone biosynthesis protein